MSDYKIKYSVPADVGQIKNLMKSVFEDEDDFLDRFFNLFYHDNVLLSESNGSIVSMAFLLPNTIRINGKLLPITYLYACATHPEHRGRGLMSQIIAKAYEDVCQRGEVGLLLLPANESLYQYYSDMGFITSFFFDEIQFSQDECFPSEEMPPFKIEKITAKIYHQLRKSILTAELSILNPLQYFLLMEDNSDINDHGFYQIFRENDRIAICYLSKFNNILRVKELLPSDTDLKHLPAFLAHSFDAKQIVVNILGTKKKSAQIKLNDSFSYLETKKGYFNFGLE